MRLTPAEKSYLHDLVAGTLRPEWWSEEARVALMDKLKPSRRGGS